MNEPEPLDVRGSEPRNEAGGDERRVRLTIRGRVQGVWFRGSAQEQARRLGVVGWARNRPDGSVEIVAQGAARALEAFVEWCGRGPTGARVDSIARDSEAAGTDLARFEIRG